MDSPMVMEGLVLGYSPPRTVQAVAPDESALSLASKNVSEGGISWPAFLVVLGVLVGLAAFLEWRSRRARKGRQAAAGPASELKRLMAEAEELAERLAATLDAKAERLERLISQADRVAGRSKPVDAIEARPEPLQAQVYSLADDGLPASEIARRTGQPQGHVELILNLRGRSRAVVRQGSEGP